MPVQLSDNLEQSIERFWQLEEIPKPFESVDDKLAEEIFTSTMEILENGTFRVNLPLKTPSAFKTLGDSFCIVKNQSMILESNYKKTQYFSNLIANL